MQEAAAESQRDRLERERLERERRERERLEEEAAEAARRAAEAAANAPVEIGPVSGANCTISGEGLKKTFTREVTTFTIEARDANGNRRLEGGDDFDVSIRGSLPGARTELEPSASHSSVHHPRHAAPSLTTAWRVHPCAHRQAQGTSRSRCEGPLRKIPFTSPVPFTLPHRSPLALLSMPLLNLLPAPHLPPLHSMQVVDNEDGTYSVEYKVGGPSGVYKASITCSPKGSQVTEIMGEYRIDVAAGSWGPPKTDDKGSKGKKDGKAPKSAKGGAKSSTRGSPSPPKSAKSDGEHNEAASPTPPDTSPAAKPASPDGSAALSPGEPSEQHQHI